MAKSTGVTEFQPQSSGMIFVVTFFTLLIVNSIVLAVANRLFPHNIVIGTHALSYVWGIGMSMGKLALIGTLALPFVHMYENSRKRMFSSMEWMALYLVLNFVAVWVITRFSEQFGLGVTSWMVVAGLAIAFDIAQGIAMTLIGKVKLN